VEILKIFARVLRFAQLEKPVVCSLVLAATVVASAQIAESVLFGHVIDALAADTGFVRYLGVWFAIGALNVGVSIFLTITADRFSHRHRMRTTDDAFEKAISVPYSFHALQGSGKIVRTILNGTDQVFWVTVVFFMGNMSAIFGVLIVIPLAFILAYRMACLLLVLAVIYGVSNWFIVRRTYTKQANVDLRHQDLAARIVDVIGNIAVIRSFDRVKEEGRLFRGLTRGILLEQYPVLNWWGALNLITRLSAMFSMLAIVAYGSIRVRGGHVSAGEVVTFVGFSNLLITRLDQLSSAFNRVVSQAPTLKNLFDLLDGVHVAPSDRSGVRVLPLHSVGNVSFSDVTFQYGEKRQGVFNLSFEARAGQTVALVGPSGAGKTTTLALLQRLLSPQAGKISIDDLNIQDLSVASLCANVATVFQDPGLFNRSIRENILVGKPSATREEVEAAAMRADAHDFIMERPEGYDFVIGERGVALSGGERQRIAIARAILKDAPILILDEATSALDNESEKKVRAAVHELRKSKTTLVIAHRLSTIIEADRILVFSEGRIVESGSFSQLQKDDGLFARLLKAGQLGESRSSEYFPSEEAVTVSAP
jgi:ATP-binding cassette, subfamily B, beta-glucan exporter